MRTLSYSEARRVYNRIGRKQDTQALYEDRAVAELLPHLDLGAAQSVFEFGCGTARFAMRLLAEHLRESATYRGIDLSPVMVELARHRLARFGPRATVKLSDGGPPTDEPSESYDRFLSNFVLDLLPLEDITRVLGEAHRLLRPEGLLGLSSLTNGFTFGSRVVAWLLAGVHAVQPSLVGGCRSLELLELLPANQWRILHHARVAPLSIPLAAVVAQRVRKAAV